ncbi:dentin sialophosphoprotein isoform X1 [Thunnus maccoyii]|uniref:dentin sialophosphoprotein isoform X1 n=1 Tax=Thunnus maccoyii TaxID=8240 RepID=UPI001C4BFB7D|nr:dentin sialophosphoprotein isoform X1 [Thunnus maccoyii]XP_042269138.1 dentin sialophosphoprotein isoform X1 [Thunnus maccoyii]XP_042269139.1 dentin sialophosphoprotein isoform X1 [Thunnus maccoyii]
MAATEASAAPVVQEDGKTPESKPTEAEQPAKTANANSETVNSEVVEKDGTAVNSEVVDKDGTAVNSEVVDNKETVNNDAAGAEDGAGAASGEAAPPQSSENASSAEPKTSFLDSFLNKSGLGKVMGGRKKKEQSTAGGEENAAEGGEKEGEKGGEEAAAAEGGAEGGAEGEAAIEKTPENGEKEEEKKGEKGKPAEAKSTVRDLIRKPVARIFSHRSTEKKDGAAAAEPQKKVKVRSKSLDRLEDPEALNTTADSTIEEGGAAGGAEGGAEGEQKASSSSATTKHMKRWHSFKKLMAQKAHKKSGGGGEDGKEDGVEGEGGGGDSSTLDSKESGQKRWKLKRSWTFQGLKRDPSMVGISGKAKTSDKDSADTQKPEEAAAAGEAEGGEEAKAEGEAEEAKTEGGEEKEKAEGGEAAVAGGGTVTHHANEIWTSFKKRVIPKSKRANTECPPTGEEDGTAATTSGEEGAAEEGKDGKSAKAKRSHFGRAVSLKNFILRKGKSTSVDQGEGTKEEEEAAEGGEGGEAAEEADADGEAATANEETNDKDAAAAAAEKTPAAENAGEAAKEAEKTPVEAPVTNGQSDCANGTAEENATHNHQGEEEKTTTGSSPVKKSKEAGGAKEEANSKIINATAAVNSGELEHADWDSAEPQNSSSSKEGDTNNRLPALTDDSSKQTKTSRQETELALATKRRETCEATQRGLELPGIR